MFKFSKAFNSAILVRRESGGGGWVGGCALPYKRDGVLVEKFEQNPYEVPRSCFMGVA